MIAHTFWIACSMFVVSCLVALQLARLACVECDGEVQGKERKV